MKKYRRYMITSAFLFAVLIAVWLFSQQAGDSSNSLSQYLTAEIIRFFDLFHLGTPVQKFFYYIDLRKVAHLAVFALIGFLIIYLVPLNKVYLRVIVAFGAGLVTGIADELHQSFSQDRIASWTDVLIDLLGIAVGVGTFLLCRQIYGHIKEGRNETN